MNEIQRFKKDRMIVKALDGTKTRYDAGNLVHAGRDTWGDYLYYDNRTGDLVKASSDPDKLKRDGFAIGSIARSAAELKTNPYASHGINWGWNPFKSIDTHTFGSYQGKLVGKPAVKQAAKVQTNTAKPLTVQQSDVREVVATSKARKPVVRGQQYWDNEFATFMGGLTTEQLKWLKANGLDNANALQTYLNANNYYDGGINNNNIDNKFGGNSKTAWNKFVASGVMGKNRDLEILAEKLKEAQPVVDAPDPFGYKTSNHYGDGMALKGLGFNNYAGLQAYAKTSTDLFAQDLRKRFGDDVSAWDLAAVEGSLGVSGKYRGGRAGDFGDIARSMADWAGKTNAAYDTKKQASLTGASGTVYSSPEIMKKFESVKVSPEVKFGMNQGTKFDFSNMKFNSGFGTTGANTLGDAGAGTMNNQKQLAYADK